MKHFLLSLMLLSMAAFGQESNDSLAPHYEMVEQVADSTVTVPENYLETLRQIGRASCRERVSVAV